MQIRRFQAADMRSALQRIRAEVGGDAVILQTRQFRRRVWRNLFGLWGRPWVEVTVAWDEGGPARARSHDLEEPPAGQLIPRCPAEGRYPGITTGGEGGHLPRATAAATQGPAPGPGWPSPRVGQEVRTTGRLDVTVGEGPLVAVPTATRAVPASPSPPSGGTGGPQRELQGVVVALGPSGAGKTTTLAKIAAQATLLQGRTVALVAADTYRLAATAALQAYAEVLDVPMAVAYSAEEVAQQVGHWREQADLVLVDTAGRTLVWPEVAAEMERLLTAARADRALLVLPATLAVEEAEAIARALQGAGLTDVVLTKLDEALSPQRLLAAVDRWPWPLTWIGCGQRVPEDLLPATPEHLDPWWRGARPGDPTPAATGGR